MSYRRYASTDEVVNRINSNYEFTENLKRIALIEDRFEERCVLLTMLGDYSANCVTGVYADAEIENALRKMAEEIETVSTVKQDKSNYLIVMSVSANQGGHSVLVNNWPYWDEDNTYSLVVTKQFKEDVVGFVQESIYESGGEIYSLEECGGYYERAQRLRAISANYSRIVLFTHMNDIIPLLAYGTAEWKVPIYFYNHADFRFSYNMTIADAVLNLNDIDARRTAEIRGCKCYNYVLEFPNSGMIIRHNSKDERLAVSKQCETNCLNDIYVKYDIDSTCKLIISAGDEFKYSDIVNCSFVDYVKSLYDQLKQNFVFLIIGPSIDTPKWRELESYTNGRARAVGYISREDFESLIALADLFVCSFPMTANGSYTAYNNHVPVLSLKVTERTGFALNQNSFANSIEELVRKTIEVLNGEKESFLFPMKHNPDKSEWKKKWHGIVETVNVHKNHVIYPQRVIDTMEIVNCQLLATERAESDSMMNVTAKYPFQRDILFEIEKKNELSESIFPERMYISDRDYRLIAIQSNKEQQKYERLFTTMSNWLWLEKRGVHIADYYSKRGIRNIAIYGYGIMGQHFYDSLKGSPINVITIIDKRMGEKAAETTPKIIVPEAMSEEVDVVVNTTGYANSVICMELEKHYEWVSLMDVINTIFTEMKSVV